MFTKNPSLSDAGIAIGAGVVGAKVGDGIAALIPQDYSKYAKGGLAVLSFLGAAYIDPKSKGGKFAQAALVGMGIKAGADAVSELLKPSIDVQDNGTTTGKFLNAIIGHDTTYNGEPIDNTARLSMPSAPWEDAAPYEDAMWERPQAEQAPQGEFYLLPAA